MGDVMPPGVNPDATNYKDASKRTGDTFFDGITGFTRLLS
jgi:hypothetical protein